MRCVGNPFIGREILTVAASALLLSACTDSLAPEIDPSPSGLRATIIEKGLLSCFQRGDDGDKVNCEASAVVISGAEVIVANDEAVRGDGRSSLFALPAGNVGGAGASPRYLTAPPVLAVEKLEAMTVTPDGAFILAATAFDRMKPDSAELDGFNVLLAWPAGDESRMTVVAESSRDGVTSSRDIKDKIAKALRSDTFPNGVPHFKAEGLAALPGGRLLFGIREVGRSYMDSKPVIKIVEVSFEVRENSVFLGDAFQPAYSFDASDVTALGRKPVGLSSLEYDPFANRLYLLTSRESEKTSQPTRQESKVCNKEFSGFLWTLALDDLNAGHPPELVRADDGTPFVFAHKPEGLAVIDAERILVVHDNDGCLPVCQDASGLEGPLCQKSHQAPFVVLRLSSPGD